MNLGKNVENKKQYINYFESSETMKKRVLDDAKNIGKLLVVTDHEDLIIEGNNETATRAAKMIQDVYGIKVGAKINLENVTQNEGSALCLAVLEALNNFWELNRPVEKLLQLSTLIR